MTDRQRIRELIVSICEEQLRSYYRWPGYKFNRSEANLAMADVIITEIKKAYGGVLQNISENYVTNFIIFSIGTHAGKRYYKTTTKRSAKNAVEISWILGRPTFLAYLKASKYELYKTRKKVQKITASRGHRKRAVEEALKKNDTDFALIVNLNRYEEIEKQRYLNTVDGFLWCGTETTLFNDESPVCMECEFRIDCRRRLKEELPKIYDKRGYE